MRAIYNLRKATHYIESVQQASLSGSPHLGLEQTHGLFGSTQWWGNIQSGQLPLICLKGSITAVWAEDQGDTTMFRVREDSGVETIWRAEFHQQEDEQLFLEGTFVEIDYVEQRFKDERDGISRCIVELRLGEVQPVLQADSPAFGGHAA